jgi:pimeloyl-ACP methyl ester carboxylesterase
MAAWHKAPLIPPSVYVSGDRDLVYNWPGMTELVAKLRRFSVPNLKRAVVLEGCGHWTQQERASEVNELLLHFLAGFDA